MNSEALKSKIKEKYRSIMRFAHITDMSYSRIMEILESGEGPAFKNLIGMVKATPDRPTPAEITPDMLKQAEAALQAYQNGARGFCRDNGFNLTWVKQMLSGQVRFHDGVRAARFFKTLNIKTLNDGPTDDKHPAMENTLVSKLSGGL